MKKRLSIIVSLFILVAFSMQALAFASIPVKSIKLNASTISIKVGQTYTLKATLNPSNTTQKTLTFSTANAKVATVDKTGKIKGIKAGKTVITVTSTANKNVLAKCNVTVIGADKTATLKWYVAGAKQPDHDLVMTEINKSLVAKINAKLDLRVLDAGTFNDKMKMIVAANENYDICFTASWRNNFWQNVAWGAFTPLDDLIAKNTTVLKTAVPDSVMNVAKVNGKIYAVPNTQVMYTSWGFNFQKELLDKYKFDIKTIKNFTDIEPFLEIIKKNEPSLIPYRQNYSVYGIDEEIISTFTMIKKGDKSLKILPIQGSKEEKYAQNLLRDWFNKGYIRKDILTITDDSAELKANKYAVQPTVMKPGGDVELSTKYAKEWVSIPFEKPYLQAAAGASTMNAISSNSKNPVKAIKLIELVNTDKEIFNTLIFGLENIHYTKISQDTVDVPKDSKYQFGTMSWVFGNVFNSFYMKGQTPGIWDETDRLNKTAEVSVLRGFNPNTAPIQAEIAKLNAVALEFKNMQFMSDYETKYPAYLEKMKTAGLDKVVAEYQKQVDAWAKANGKK